MTVGKSYADNAIDIQIGSRVKAIREIAGESQGDLANAIGVSREIIQHWERGSRMIKAGHLIKIAMHYSVSSDYLLGVPTRFEQSDVEIQKNAIDSIGLPWKTICEIKTLSEKNKRVLSGMAILLNTESQWGENEF